MATDIFTVESGALPGATRVAAFEGTERLSTAYELTAWLLVPGADAMALDPDAVLLRPGTLRVLRDDASPRLGISGVWSSLELVHEAPGGDALYRAVLVPTWWKLKLSRHSRVWVDKTVPQIIEDVFRKAALPAARYALRLSGRYEPRPHVCQYRESDFDFVSRWMEREGIYYFFEHADDGETMVLTDDKARHQPFGGGGVEVLHETGAGDSGTEGFRTFSLRHAAASAGVRVHDYDPLRPTDDPDAEVALWARGYGSLVRHQQEFAADADDARRLAGIRAEQGNAARVAYRGTGRVFDVRVGYRFAVSGHPRASLDQDYLCTAVRHRGRLLVGEHELARFIPVDGHRVYTAEVEALPADVQFRAPFKAPTPRVRGVEIGRVDGAMASEYAQIDEHGRYRVNLLFDELPHETGVSSTWVRMLQPHAGVPEGWHFPLRKDTEVMVAFVGGDPDRPVIAGAIPNAETPASVTGANHTHNVVHTGGNSRIEIEDQAGSQYVDISTPPQNTYIHLGALHGAHDHNYITWTDGNGHIHTGGVLNVTVGGQKNERVTGAVIEDYDQTQSTDVTAAVTESYHANLTTSVTLHCQENYNATQTTEVQTHTEETCQVQETTVSGHLDEHHGTQTTNVDTLLKTVCDTELFDTGNATHTDGTLTWTIHNGALIKANTFLMQGPRFDMTARTVHTVVRPNEQKITVGKDSYTPFKFEAAFLSLKANGIARSTLGVKMEMIRGTAYELTGAKVEVTGAKIALSNFAWEAYLVEHQVSGLQLALTGLLLCL